MINKKLKDAVKTSDLRLYEIAKLAGLHPSTASAIINDIVPIKPYDQRVIRIGKVVGIKPEECFNTKNGKESKNVKITKY